MTSPRVTIGLPVYNGERFLAETIDSILKQDFEDFELLVCDNASLDRTLEIALAAAERDTRITVHRSEMNRGAAWNYNRAVDRARGSYFKWAAHDDLLEPTFLSRCVAVLDAEPHVVLSYTRAIDIDESGTVVHRHDLQAYATSARPADRARSVLLDPSPCMESFGLIRMDALRRTAKIGPYTSSDRTLFLELALIGEFREVPEVLFLHRQHPDRSVHQFADPRLRNLWFDPAWAGRASSPRWRLLREYVLAIRRSPASARARMETTLLVPRWIVQNRRPLAREAAAFVLGRGRAHVSPTPAR